MKLAGKSELSFDEARDLLFHRDIMYPPGAQTQHPNGVRFTAFDAAGAVVDQRTFISVGGGFIVEDGAAGKPADESDVHLPYPFHSAAELLEVARRDFAGAVRRRTCRTASRRRSCLDTARRSQCAQLGILGHLRCPPPPFFFNCLI